MSCDMKLKSLRCELFPHTPHSRMSVLKSAKGSSWILVSSSLQNMFRVAHEFAPSFPTQLSVFYDKGDLVLQG